MSNQQGDDKEKVLEQQKLIGVLKRDVLETRDRLKAMAGTPHYAVQDWILEVIFHYLTTIIKARLELYKTIYVFNLFLLLHRHSCFSSLQTIFYPGIEKRCGELEALLGSSEKSSAELLSKVTYLEENKTGLIQEVSTKVESRTFTVQTCAICWTLWQQKLEYDSGGENKIVNKVSISYQRQKHVTWSIDRSIWYVCNLKSSFSV